MIKPIRGIVIWVKPEEGMARVVELKGNRKVYIPLSAQRPPFIQNHEALFRSFWPASELPLPAKGDCVLFEEATNVVYAQPTALVWCFQRDAFLAIHQFEMTFRVICPECPHTMGDHNEFGECQKCNCGTWEEPDDLYAHGRHSGINPDLTLADLMPTYGPDLGPCPDCGHPLNRHNGSRCDVCDCGRENDLCTGCGHPLIHHDNHGECSHCECGWPDCNSCGHSEFEHQGGECQHINCHCGDQAYDVVPGMEMYEPKEVRFTEGSAGHHGYA